MIEGNYSTKGIYTLNNGVTKKKLYPKSSISI